MNSTRILIVDDEPQIRRTLRALLVQHGYIVRETASGQGALEEIRQEMPS